MYFFMLAALAFLSGIAVNTVLKKSVTRLESESESLEHTELVFFKQMKLKYDNSIKAGHEIRSIENFARKYLARYRYLGMSIETLSKASKTTSGLCLIFGVCGALYDRKFLTEFLLIGFLSMYIVNGLRGLVDVKERTGRVMFNIVDYFESRTIAATKEVVVEPVLESKAVPVASEEHIAEENAVINDILMEYLS